VNVTKQQAILLLIGVFIFRGLVTTVNKIRILQVKHFDFCKFSSYYWNLLNIV